MLRFEDFHSSDRVDDIRGIIPSEDVPHISFGPDSSGGLNDISDETFGGVEDGSLLNFFGVSSDHGEGPTEGVFRRMFIKNFLGSRLKMGKDIFINFFEAFSNVPGVGLDDI